MKISDAIARLEELKEAHGDLYISGVFNRRNYVINHIDYRKLTRERAMGGYEVMEWIFISDYPVDLRDHFNIGANE